MVNRGYLLWLIVISKGLTMGNLSVNQGYMPKNHTFTVWIPFGSGIISKLGRAINGLISTEFHSERFPTHPDTKDPRFQHVPTIQSINA